MIFLSPSDRGKCAAVLALAFCGVGLLAGCTPQKAAVVPAAPPPPRSEKAATNAADWWAHTLAAAQTTPLRADLAVMLFNPKGEITQTEHFKIEEGTESRYWLTQEASGVSKKRIVVSDGETAWDYDAGENIVWKRQAASLQTPPQWREGVAGAKFLADAVRPELERGTELIAGRAVQKLALRSKKTGQAVECRWIDRETYRTLRMEEYGSKNAHPLRRWELSHISFGGANEARLRPDFPASARLRDSASVKIKPSPDATETARRAHLPLHARGFALRSVVRADALKSAEKAAGGGDNAPLPANAAQLLYRNADQAISIFVTPREKKALTLRPGPDWKAAQLKEGRSGYTQETDNGTAIAWTAPNGSDEYIAVSRMPLRSLLPVVESLAASHTSNPASTPLPLSKK